MLGVSKKQFQKEFWACFRTFHNGKSDGSVLGGLEGLFGADSLRLRQKNPSWPFGLRFWCFRTRCPDFTALVPCVRSQILLESCLREGSCSFRMRSECGTIVFRSVPIWRQNCKSKNIIHRQRQLIQNRLWALRFLANFSPQLSVYSPHRFLSDSLEMWRRVNLCTGIFWIQNRASILDKTVKSICWSLWGSLQNTFSIVWTLQMRLKWSFSV